MEQPFIGKLADVYNKKAIVAISKGRGDLAIKYWT